MPIGRNSFSAVASVGLDTSRSTSCNVRADTPHTLAYSAIVRRKLVRIFLIAICGDEPRMMVAEGFCRLGLMSLAYP